MNKSFFKVISHNKVCIQEFDFLQCSNDNCKKTFAVKVSDVSASAGYCPYCKEEF